MERPSVLLAMDGDATAYLDALRRAGFEAASASTAPIAEQLSAGLPDIAVIDCDLLPERVAEIYSTLHRGMQVPTLLLVGTETVLLDALSGSATDEVALKPVPPEALVYRLQAFLIRTGRNLPVESGSWAASESLSTAPIAGEGHVVSIFAPKGGVGKTTVAVNLAVALREQTRSEVLLFDADVGVGNVTAVLEFPYRFGLSDIAENPPEDWTDAAFEQAVATHAGSGLRVLTWGRDPAESERVSVDLLLAALRWARMHHAYVVVDNHPGYDDRTMAMLATSNEIFLVITPEMGALRNSAQFMELARELGLATGVKVIVNRANHGIRIDDLASALGMPVAATIVSSGPKAVIAANEGKPLITKFPREKISSDLYRVARLISNPDAAPAPAKQARSWWMRLGQRASSEA